MGVRFSAWMIAAAVASFGAGQALADDDVLMFKSEQGTIAMDQSGQFNSQKPETTDSGDDSGESTSSGFSMEVTAYQKEFTHGEGTGNEQGMGTISLLSFDKDTTTATDLTNMGDMSGGNLGGIGGLLPLDEDMLSATGPGSIAGSYNADVAGDVAQGLKSRRGQSGANSNSEVSALTGDISSQISAGGYSSAADGSIGMTQGVVQGGAADMVNGYLP